MSKQSTYHSLHNTPLVVTVVTKSSTIYHLPPIVKKTDTPRRIQFFLLTESHLCSLHIRRCIQTQYDVLCRKQHCPHLYLQRSIIILKVQVFFSDRLLRVLQGLVNAKHRNLVFVKSPIHAHLNVIV